MSKKIVSRLFVVGFFMIFAIMAGIMIKGLIEQNKDEEQQTARYEQMKTDGGKTLLTQDILEEDHAKYVKDAEEGEKTFITLLVLFAGVFVWFIVTSIFRLVLKGMEEGATASFRIILCSFVVAMIVFVAAIFGVVNFLVPRLGQDPGKDGYFFTELKLVDSEKEEKLVESGTGTNRTSHTEVNYYLIDDSGKKHSVKKLFYDRYASPGIYYAGQTTRGNIFSLYPDTFFELPVQ